MIGTSTRAVHEGERHHQTSDAITAPIHQTATYWFRDSEELRAFQEGRLKRDEMPVLISYWDQTPEARLRFGITDSLVRYSCGIEDSVDLIADLEQALRAE